MSKHLTELCTLLVDDVYGQLPSRLLSTLLTNGRLSLPLLLRRTQLPPRHVKAGLAILIQKHLLLYHVSDSEETTYFEANPRNAYELVRIGKSVDTMRNALQKPAPDLVEHFLFQDTATIEEALIWRDEPVSKANRICNGDGHANENHESTRSERDGAILDRLKAMADIFDQQYAVKARQLDYMPEYDFDDMITNHVLEHQGHPKTKDDKVAFGKAIVAHKRDLRYSEAPLHFDAVAFSRIKRRAGESDSLDVFPEATPNKQRKLNLGRGYGDDTKTSRMTAESTQTNGRLPEVGNCAEETNFELAFRINLEKLDVARRNEHLVAMASKCLDGDAIGAIYQALLSCATKEVKYCYNQDDEVPEDHDDEDERVVLDDDEDAEDGVYKFESMSPVVSTESVEMHLGPGLDLNVFFQPQDDRRKQKRKLDGDVVRPGKKLKTSNGYLGKLQKDDDENEDNQTYARQPMNDEHVLKTKRVQHVHRILEILADHPHQFVRRIDRDGQHQWYVNFAALCRTLIQTELENLITARFGTLATLIVRHLVATGKVEEKAIASACILPVKDVRAALSAMQAVGLVETQEVPKDFQRMPVKTIYLWFFDQNRCRTLVLNDVYKSMCRLLQRRRVEKAKVQSVLGKAERTDVRGREDLYLNETEKKKLRNWEDTEEKILVQVSRLDDMVTILRDFLPPKML